MTSRWPNDDQLMAELADAVRSAGDVPPDIVAAAKAVYELRNLDAELARLTYDSRLDAELVGALRSDDKLSVRSLVFGLGEVSVDLDVLPGSLVGQVSPALAGRITAETRDGVTVEADVDELGMFSLVWTHQGEMRLHVDLHDRPAFVAEWTRI